MKKKMRIFFALLLILCVYVFSLFFGAQSIREAVYLCIKSLVPGLFCSVVFSLYLAKSGLWTYLGHGAVALTALLCGFPTGAVMASSLYENGEIPKEQAERICSLFSLPSPAFVISVTGGEIHGSFFMGAVLYFILLMSLLVCDMIFYPNIENTAPKKKCRALVSSFVNSVSEGGTKCLAICSFVMFFYVLGSAFTAFVSLNKPFGAVLLALLEMTRAVKAISALSPNTAFILTAFALAFSGISVGAQVGFYALNSGLTMRGYFEKRFLLSAVAVLISLSLLYLPPFLFAALCGGIIFCFILKRKYLQKRSKDKKNTEKTPYERVAYISADKAKNNT